MVDIQYRLNQLLNYGLKCEMFKETDSTYIANRLIDFLHLNTFTRQEVSEEPILVVIEDIIDYAHEKGILPMNDVDSRDRFDSALMDILMPRPSEVEARFWSLYQGDRKHATDFFYQLNQDSNYIRMDRIAKNRRWKSKTAYGELDITINLSKPEKDPKAIAMAKSFPKHGYPQCVICPENEGYRGTVNHPGRSNHRLIELTLDGAKWYLQYSPYVYYNEHCIVLSGEHEPMRIHRGTFKRCFQFVEAFPHYFLGSNADLPIVGGSILSHDHFQGGNYEFPLMKQGLRQGVNMKAFPEVETGILNWPMSVIRLRHPNYEPLIELSDQILHFWRDYSDEESSILATSQGEVHNTITPIVRFARGMYEIYLVLRNNRTSSEHPLGIFHPHAEHHHIKKENIGLIEVMGLAVLPARLKHEMEAMKGFLLTGGEGSLDSNLAIHAAWLRDILMKYPSIEEATVDEILKDEIALVFSEILGQCGVFKSDDRFNKFLEAFNQMG